MQLALLMGSICSVGMLAGIATAAETAAWKTLYAAPNGGDGPHISCEAPDSPGSLFRAQQRVRELNQSMQGDIVIKLQGGRYELQKTFTLTNLDSGLNGHRVIWKAGDGQPVLSGGRKITQWTTDTSGAWQAPCSFDGFRFISVNGQWRARAMMKEPIRGKDWLLDEKKNKTGIVFDAKEFGTYANAKDLELWTRCPGSGWEMHILPITKMQPVENGTVAARFNVGAGVEWKLGKDSAANLVFFKDLFWVTGSRELMDEAGEWSLESGVLRYIPWEDMAAAEVIVPALEEVIRIDGASEARRAEHIVFDGIAVAHSTWMEPNTFGFWAEQCARYLRPDPKTGVYHNANFYNGAITINRARNISFLNGEVFGTTGAGISMIDYVADVLIERCTIRDTGFAGILAGSWCHGSKRPNQPIGGVFHVGAAAIPERISVVNCEIARTGRCNWNGSGIEMIWTRGSRMEHNYIHDTSSHGITLGLGWDSNVPLGGDNRIARNCIIDPIKRVADNGAIYLNGWSEQGKTTMVLNNYVRNLNPNVGAGIVAFYSDNGSSDFVWRNNVADWSPSGEGKASNPPHERGLYDSNWYSTSRHRTNAGITYVHDPILVLDRNWPEEARKAVEDAGIEGRRLEIINIAKGKPVLASSSWSGVNPTAGVDDNLRTDWADNGKEANSWWQVDLEKPQVISRIELLARQSHQHPEQQRNFAVWVSNDPAFKDKVVVGEQFVPLERAATWTRWFEDPKGYRYVRVQRINNAGHFGFSELQVFGHPADSP